MQVTVLFGGPSAEREISLISGNAVIDGLRSMGHTVFPSDISPTDLTGLDQPCNVVFPVLHGQFGESGELQEILESRKLKFVGSGSKASRLGMNKVDSKKAWESAGLPTPPYVILTGKESGGWKTVGLPCVVKAVSSGSSIDVYICKSADEAEKACGKVLQTYGKALVEKFITGPELTCGILEEKPLWPIQISTSREFYDFEAKYKGNYTNYDLDPKLPRDVLERVRTLAQKAHEVIGCRDLSRVDVMLDGQHNPYLLEINTLPGFTPKSLLPKAARQAGIEFGPLVDRLVKRAFARG